MASIVICGGSVLGLATGMLLARDGHDVTVLENDETAVPGSPTEAWSGWRRKGVPQFRQPHNLFPRVRQVLEAEIPEVMEELLAGGCVWTDMMESVPPSLQHQPRRAEDDRFRYVTGRRPVVERAFALAAEREPGLTVRRGLHVTGLLDGAPTSTGVPRVTGVTTAGGGEISADLTIDAMGRRSPALGWLTSLGATPPFLESSDVGFVYYTRYFTGPELPRLIGPAMAEMGTFSILTLPGDNDTWSVTLFGSNRDAVFKRVRESECFSHLVRACPAHAHWLQGEPVTDVLSMADVLDRYRRFVVAGRPVATGYAAVGDAWACTNPAAGRGLSVGLAHAQLLRDTIRSSGGDDPEGFSLAWDEATERAVTPYVRNQKAADNERFAAMTALRERRDPPAPESRMQAFAAAMPHDGELFRGFLETVACLALPDEVLARPGMLDRLERVGTYVPLQMPAPTREKLEHLLS
jgi:2-polyprenyl-6-methoxyphenol hydroxylase-like FAD-dependent oxidoreductase